MNQKQHAVGREYIHSVVNGRQLIVKYSVGVRRNLHELFTATRNGNLPLSTMAFVCTFREIKHDAVICGEMIAADFPDKHP